jgi:hypothetical protein
MNWHGAWLFAKDSEIGEKPAWRATSGIFSFNDIPRTKDLFDLVLKTRQLTRQGEVKHFGDQPLLNYAATLMNLVDINLFDGKSINGSSMEALMEEDSRILKHVSLGVGEGDRKELIMEQVVEALTQRHPVTSSPMFEKFLNPNALKLPYG